MRCDRRVRRMRIPRRYFNPRTSYEMRQLERENLGLKQTFQSTHLVWDATLIKTLNEEHEEFQSTHLVWDATKWPGKQHSTSIISIHAPRMRCDVKDIPTFSAHSLFQSTHLVWDATDLDGYQARSTGISIHAPRMRCDGRSQQCIVMLTNFNPRTSYEMRHRKRL